MRDPYNMSNIAGSLTLALVANMSAKDWNAKAVVHYTCSTSPWAMVLEVGGSGGM